MEPERAAAAFLVVADVAASWPDYRLVRLAMDESGASGLILHAAGWTDEGFRTIDLWKSEEDYDRFRPHLNGVFEGLSAPPVVRQLRVQSLRAGRPSDLPIGALPDASTQPRGW